MTMKKKLLPVAVGAALGASALSMNAQADALLFPVFIEQPGAVTFLTLRSDAGGDIHYTWSYDPDLNDDIRECIHADATGDMTPFDMVHQTVVLPSLGAGLDLPALFGDASTVRYLNVPNVTGFLIVQDDSGEGAFGGQAIIVDSTLGIVTAYKGFNNPIQAPNAASTDVDFDSLPVSQASHDFTWYPTNIVNTAWFVLVTGTDMTDLPSWQGQFDLSQGFGGIFDRDENFRSGQQINEIICNELLTLPLVLTGDQLFHAANGGWSWMTQSDYQNNATGALVFKIEITTALGPIRTAISSENAFPNFPY